MAIQAAKNLAEVQNHHREEIPPHHQCCRSLDDGVASQVWNPKEDKCCYCCMCPCCLDLVQFACISFKSSLRLFEFLVYHGRFQPSGSVPVVMTIQYWVTDYLIEGVDTKRIQ